VPARQDFQKHPPTASYSTTFALNSVLELRANPRLLQVSVCSLGGETKRFNVSDGERVGNLVQLIVDQFELIKRSPGKMLCVICGGRVLGDPDVPLRAAGISDGACLTYVLREASRYEKAMAKIKHELDEAEAFVMQCAYAGRSRYETERYTEREQAASRAPFVCTNWTRRAGPRLTMPSRGNAG